MSFPNTHLNLLILIEIYIPRFPNTHRNLLILIFILSFSDDFPNISLIIVVVFTKMKWGMEEICGNDFWPQHT